MPDRELGGTLPEVTDVAAFLARAGAGAPGSEPPAAPAASGLSSLRALTLHHRAIGLTALSTAALTPDDAAALHANLHARGVRSVVLATCNRTELYWQARDADDDAVAQAAFAGALRTSHVPQRLDGAAAAEHLFRVCAGLESVVLGEAEILGQVRAALTSSAHAGGFLTGIVQAALRTGRLARARTAIGVGAMSVASAAVHLLAERLDLAHGRVLVIGSGATAVKVARHLRSLGVGRLVVANRTLAHAVSVAERVGAIAAPLEALAGELAEADAVFGAAAAPDLLVTAEMLAAAGAQRAAAGATALVAVDLAMPPIIATVDAPGVVRLDLRAVERHVADQAERRSAEVPEVMALVRHELAFLDGWARQQLLRPLVADLRRKAEDVRVAELTRMREAFAHASDADVAALDRFSRRLLDRVLALSLAPADAGEPPA